MTGARNEGGGESREPAVSVVLPTYNGREFVGEAVASMLAQTFDDFELIVIDDGSTDGTPDVLRRYTDPRIRLFTQPNRGLAATLNRGIELARGRYIARQDQDDRSLPERMAKQVAFLETHPDCALVGTWAEIWSDNRRTERRHVPPSDGAELKFFLLFNNAFVHSSVMIRKAALDRVGAYTTDRGRQPPEDFELWSRIAREFDVANIPEVLHVYREVEGSMSRIGPSPFMEQLVTICAENIAWAVEGNPADAQILNIAALEHGAPHRMAAGPDFSAMRGILRGAAMRVAGDQGRRYAREADRRVDALRRRWWQARHGHGWRRHLFRLAHRVLRVAGRR